MNGKIVLLLSIILSAVLLVCACSGKNEKPAVTGDALENAVKSFEPSFVADANVAVTGYAMASSSKRDAGFSNLNINDGDRKTGFSTAWDNVDAGDEVYVFIDLTCVRELESVVLYPMKGYEELFPVDFTIQVSDDDITYQTVHTASSADGKKLSDGYKADISGSHGRYVKLVATKLYITPETGFAMILSEFEINAGVDTSYNMVLNRDNMWMYLNPSSTQVLKAERYLSKNGGGSLSFMSSNPEVATVDENGLVTAVGFGEATVYVYDGVNLSECKISVLDDSLDARITVFSHSSFGHPGIVKKELDYYKEAGIDYIEETRTYDMCGNDISMYHIFLCSERGLFYSPNDADGDANFLKLSDGEIIELVRKYENRAGFFGLYLQDEPHEEYAQYAHVCRVITEYNPHIIPHLNLLPPYNFDGSKEYFYDFMAAAGGSYRFRNLSYDHYPFGAGAGSFSNQIYESINMLRKAGLQYNASTGYYMQAMGIKGMYRVLNENETMYNASIGVAYGIKNFKWFVGLTPINSGEPFTTGLIGPDYEPGEMYEYVKKANEKIKSVLGIISRCDAIEVYHNVAQPGNEKIPDDFAVTLVNKTGTIFTLYQANDETKQQYIVVTNTYFTKKKATDISLKLRDGISSVQLFENGSFTDIELDSERHFTVTVDPGSFVILKLPEGCDVSKMAEASDNLALGCAAFVSSDGVGFWKKNDISATYLTDGKDNAKHWESTASDDSPEILIDLRDVKEIGKISLKSKSLDDKTNITISVSTDGINYTKINVNKSGDEYTFDRTSCRYVKIGLGVKGKVSVSEVEIY